MASSPIGRTKGSRAIRRYAARAVRVVGATGLCVTAFWVLPGCKKSGSEASAVPAPAPAAPPAAKAAGAVPEPVRKLFGKWMRSDGGYVLEIRGADLSGVVDAAYFNPKSIHVSRAIWMQGPEGFQVVVELNDVGYPGATYVLSHEPKTDRLIGKYNQPAMQQSFEIDFVRQPNP